MYCGSKVLITKDVNNINVESSFEKQIINLKSLAKAHLASGKDAEAHKIVRQIIGMNGADADIWYADFMLTLKEENYPFSGASESARTSYGNYASLSRCTNTMDELFYRELTGDETLGSILKLLYMSKKGLGTPISDRTVAKWCIKAAEMGDINSERELAEMYMAGKGVAKSEAEAARWFLESAKHGDAKS
jgi:hypothetical protein